MDENNEKLYMDTFASVERLFQSTFDSMYNVLTQRINIELPHDDDFGQFCDDNMDALFMFRHFMNRLTQDMYEHGHTDELFLEMKKYMEEK